MNTLSELARRPVRWLSDVPQHRTGVRVLQVAIGTLILFRMATEVRYALYFWGPHGLGVGTSRYTFGRTVGDFLSSAFETPAGTYAVVATLSAAGLCLLLGKLTQLSALVALLCSFMLESRLPELLDGGDNITRLSLGYMMFLVPSDRQAVRGSLRVWVHNTAVLAIMIQLTVVYLTAGFMKASGPRWTAGTALYVVSQIDWFSEPSSRWIFRNPLITTLADYGTIFFQLWFPVAILSPLRPLWVVMGIGMHLGIAYTMGLVPFSLVMIGLELFMLSDETYEAAARYAAPAVSALHRLVRARALGPQARGA